MNTHADKTQKNKRQSAANEVSQTQNGRNSISQFIDVRPEVNAQREQQEMVNDWSKTNQVSQLHSMVNYNSEHHRAIQNKADPVLGKEERLTQKGGQSLVVQRAVILGLNVTASAILAAMGRDSVLKHLLTPQARGIVTMSKIEEVCKNHLTDLQKIRNERGESKFLNAVYDLCSFNEIR